MCWHLLFWGERLCTLLQTDTSIIMKSWVLMHVALCWMPWRRNLTSTALMWWSLKLQMLNSNVEGGSKPAPATQMQGSLCQGPSVEDEDPLVSKGRLPSTIWRHCTSGVSGLPCFFHNKVLGSTLSESQQRTLCDSVCVCVRPCGRYLDPFT